MEQFVDVETPYMAKSDEELAHNLLYARACIRDCLLKEEVPFASHLFYTQPGILDDTILEERMLGINAGKKLIEALPGIITVVYTDLGISKGMQFGIDRATELEREVQYRTLGVDWKQSELKLVSEHAHAGIWGFQKLHHQK